MLVLHVHLHVKPDKVEEFKQVTLENARQSVREPGITRFVLVEVYRSKEANAAHRETEHYKKWATIAPDLLMEPRTRAFYTNVFPDDKGWE